MSHRLTASVGAFVRLVLAVGLAACGDATAPADPASVAWLDMTPTSAVLLVGRRTQLDAVPRDAQNVRVAGARVVWTSSDSTIVVVQPSTGLATAQRVGRATIAAASAGKTGTVAVLVLDLDTFVPRPAPLVPIQRGP